MLCWREHDSLSLKKSGLQQPAHSSSFSYNTREAHNLLTSCHIAIFYRLFFDLIRISFLLDGIAVDVAVAVGVLVADFCWHCTHTAQNDAKTKTRELWNRGDTPHANSCSHFHRDIQSAQHLCHQSWSNITATTKDTTKA